MTSINNYILRILYLLSIIAFITIACDRLNMFEVANNAGNKRIAFAITNTNSSNNLIIANLDFTKKYPITPTFDNPEDVGISVNRKGKVIAYQINYTYVSDKDFSYWNLYNDVNSPPYNLKVIPYNNGFIWLDTTSLYYFGDINSWNQISTVASSYEFSCLQSYDGTPYVIGYDGTTMNFYIFNPDNLNNPINIFYCSYSLTTMVNAYRTYDAFYVIFNSTSTSIFKLQNGVAECLNTLSMGAGSISSATVTDDGNIYIVHYENNSMDLKQILSDGKYPVILHIGDDFDSTYKCHIDSLDNNHLVITASGLDSGLNGMYIYNIQKMMIEKVVTTENVVALYVPR